MNFETRASITSKTALYGVIGDPIGQSYSPLIHNFWMSQAGLDAVYGAYHLTAKDAADEVRAMSRFGVMGLNVTMPHKEAAHAAARAHSPTAQALGVANTLRLEVDGLWYADNTDAAGFMWGLSKAGETEPGGKRVLVIGAGGAARAVVYALQEAGAQLTILNRTPDKAEALARALAPGAQTGGLDDLDAKIGEAEIVVNATSLGYSDQDVPTLLGEGDGRLFYDLTYGAAAEPLLAAARRSGWAVQDGLAMLVGQAAASFDLWFGQSPDRDAALTLCRNAEAARR